MDQFEKYLRISLKNIFNLKRRLHKLLPRLSSDSRHLAESKLVNVRQTLISSLMYFNPPAVPCMSPRS